VKQTLVIIVLALAYGVALGGLPHAGGRTAPAFDPLAPRPHAIELLIVGRRFAEAVPLVAELRASYPREPLVAEWQARAFAGVGRSQDAVAAWGEYLSLGGAVEDTCPSLPDALERLGHAADASAAQASCEPPLGPLKTSGDELR
jgi:hypothetical protein